MGLVKKLFDVKGMDLRATPRGVAYLESERLLAYLDPGQPAKVWEAETSKALGWRLSCVLGLTMISD